MKQFENILYYYLNEMWVVRVDYLSLCYKINNMTKKEIKSYINKLAYQFAAELGYEVIDDGMGASVTFMKPGTKHHDDTIDWHRSYHETCVLNWASDEVKIDAGLIDAHMKPIINNYNNQYSKQYDYSINDVESG